jgi:uncharacterized protein
MLTGNLVRVRHARNRLVPSYLIVNDGNWQSVAERLLVLFRGLQGCTRSEMEEEITAAVGDNPTQLVHQGLAKLLEDRCEFEVDSSLPPEEVRENVFLLSAARRATGDFDRQSILDQAASELYISAGDVERFLFADLKAEQRLIQFEDCTVEQLLDRYNVALAQAILLRATSVSVNIAAETPARYRQLFRAIKFHRLICEIRHNANGACTLVLDGPLSLFSATQKYGVQLANFLPTLLQCKRFDLEATVRWGAQRKEKTFQLDSNDGLHSHTIDYGDYIPKELSMFAEMFRKQVYDWDISSEAAMLTAGTHIWVPDFVLSHKASGKKLYLEIFGFWRKTDVDKLYRRLKTHLKEPFLLAVSEQFNIDEEMPEIQKSIYRFKRTPLPEEVAKLAGQQIS